LEYSAGTKAGEKKIPESLGLAPGLVFLLCIIFFQLLHFYDAAAVLDWVSRSAHKEAGLGCIKGIKREGVGVLKKMGCSRSQRESNLQNLLMSGSFLTSIPSNVW